MVAFIVICFLLACYFLPTIIAFARKHNNVAAIVIVNAFLGWSFIGWVVPLAWSFSDNVKKPA